MIPQRKTFASESQARRSISSHAHGVGIGIFRERFLPRLELNCLRERPSQLAHRSTVTFVPLLTLRPLDSERPLHGRKNTRLAWAGAPQTQHTDPFPGTMFVLTVASA